MKRGSIVEDNFKGTRLGKIPCKKYIRSSGSSDPHPLFSLLSFALPVSVVKRACTRVENCYWSGAIEREKILLAKHYNFVRIAPEVD